MDAHPRLFLLVNPENHEQIFAVGVDMGDEAITYRRDQEDRPQFGLYGSRARAHRYYNRFVVELDLIWADEC